VESDRLLFGWCATMTEDESAGLGFVLMEEFI
jgi:hypothetical protein